jgi:hypothetical protein
MFYSNQVNDTRKLFFVSWSKFCNREPMLPLEQQIAAVISEHPEYHSIVKDLQPENERAYYPEMGETNPFLHMGLHLAIRDQIATNRPDGISQVYKDLLQRHGDVIKVEHLMMESLAECLWEAQRNHGMPNEIEYLNACKKLI